MKHILLLISAILVVLCIHVNSKPLTQDATGPEKEYENGLELLRRITRQAAPNGNGNNKLCKYKKGSWSACDPQTKVRTRTFTLKRGDASVCEELKTIRKECKGKKEGRKKNKSGGDNPNQQQEGKREKNRDRQQRKKNNNNHNSN